MWLKRVARRGPARVLLCIAVLTLLLAGAVHTPPARRYALNVITAELRDRAGINLEASGLGFNAFAGIVELRDVAISRVGSATPFLHAPRIRVDLSLYALVRGTTIVEEGAASQVQLHVVFDELGNSNLPRSSNGSRGTSELPVFLIQQLSLQGRAQVENRRDRWSATIPGWRLDVRGQSLSTSAHQVQFRSSMPGSLRYAGHELLVHEIQFSGGFNREQATIEQSRVVTSGGSLGLKGQITGYADPKLDLTLLADVDARTLAGFAEMEPGLAGEVHAEVRARNALPNLAIVADVTASGLTFANFNQIETAARLRWDASGRSVRLENAMLKAPEATLQLQGTWAGTGADDTNRASVRIDRLDLSLLSRKLRLPAEVASTARGDLRASWPGLAFESARADARLTVAALRAQPSPRVLPVSGELRLEARGRSFRVEAGSVQVLGATVDGSVDLAASRSLSGELHATGEIGAVIAQARAFRHSPAPATDLTGDAEMLVSLGGTLAKPTARLVAQGTRLKAGPMEGAMLETTAHYDGTRVEVESARLGWKGSELNASGRIGLEGADPPVVFTASSSELAIATLLEMLGQRLPVAGRVALSASGHGTLTQPQVSISVAGRDLHAYGEELGTLEAQSTFANQTFRIEELRMERAGGGVVSGEGSYSLASRDYSVRLQANAFSLLSLDLPGTGPVRGNIDFTASGAGNLDRPALEIALGIRDARAMARDFGSLAASGTLANEQATIDLEAPKYHLRANIVGQTTAPYPLSSTVSVSNLDLAALPFDLPVAGRVTARVEASGEPTHWKDGTANVEVNDLSVVAEATEFRNRGPLRLTVKNRALEVLAAELEGPGSVFSVQGRIPLEQSSAEGLLAYRGTLDLAEISALIGEQRTLHATGSAQVSGEIRGSLRRISPTGRLLLTEGTLTTAALRAPLTGISLDATLSRSDLDIQKLSANLGTGALTAQGRIPLGLLPLPEQLDMDRQGGAARFRLKGENLELSSLTGFPDMATGMVSILAEASANTPDLKAVEADITLSQMQLALSGVEVTVEAPPRFALRNGVVNIEELALRAMGSTMRVTGSALLAEGRLRDVQVEGNVDAARLGDLLGGVRAAGAMELRVRANGAWDRPEVDGFIEMSDARISVDEPRLEANAVNIRLALLGRRIDIEKFEGNLNGGAMAVSGGVDLRVPIRPELALKANDVYLEFPVGLRSQSDINLTLQPQGEFLGLSGEISIEQGAYARQFEEHVLALFQSRGAIELAQERNPALERLRFNIAVRTQEPLAVNNNVARLGLTADLRLLGSYYRPGLAGRIDVEEGGTLHMQEREYLVDRGSITFTNEARIEPLVDLSAQTRVNDRNITLSVASGRDGFETTFTSDDPNDTRADIISLLLTGRTTEQLEGRELNVAGEQAALSLLAGSLSGRVSRQLEQSLGLTQVRIAPNLISPESDPSARLTVGQDLTSALQLIYSMNLTDSNDQIWIANYELLRRLNARATKQTDNTYRFDFQHDLRFGQKRVERQAAAIRTIGKVEVRGNLRLPRDTVMAKLRVRSGERYKFLDVRKGLDRLESLYQKEGFLEARVRMNRQMSADRVDLAVEIDAGPRITFAYENYAPSRGLEARIREAWMAGVFDAQRAEDSAALIRRDLAGKGYLQPDLQYRIAMADAARKHILFLVQTETRYSEVNVVFDGAKRIEPKTLEQVLRDARVQDKLRSEPPAVSRALQAYYRQQGYLDATVDDPVTTYDDAARQAVTRIRIAEGPGYQWGEWKAQGVSVFPADELRRIGGIMPGSGFTPAAAQQSRDRLEEAYWDKGYRDVLIDYRLAKQLEQARVDVVATVTEGPRSVVADVEVAGADRTSREFVQKQLALGPGDPLSYTKTAQSRRSLYDTGAFTSIDIRFEPIPKAGIDGSPGVKMVKFTAQVQERTPFQVRYGAFLDTDRGPGFIADFWNRNSLGGGRVAGVRARYDSQIREVRGFFSQPLLRHLPLRTDTTTFLRRESREAFTTDRIGATVQQEFRLKNKLLLNYGYRFERAHTFDNDPDAFFPFDEVLKVAPLRVSISRDSRDVLLDATRGSFASQALEFAAAKLGSNLTFARYFGQYFHYVPLSRPTAVPFGSGVEKPRVIYAGGIRLGLAGGLGGQEVIRSERFFGGGGTTMRGFGQDTLGPLDILKRPAGGNAVLVINNELRFPAFGFIDGVGFLDIGNVYPKIADFRFQDVRKSAGAGLRVRTPYLLLRFDYGLKLDRRQGESRGAFFFSIGQAF